MFENIKNAHTLKVVYEEWRDTIPTFLQLSEALNDRAQQPVTKEALADAIFQLREITNSMRGLITSLNEPKALMENTIKSLIINDTLESIASNVESESLLQAVGSLATVTLHDRSKPVLPDKHTPEYGVIVHDLVSLINTLDGEKAETLCRTLCIDWYGLKLAIDSAIDANSIDNLPASIRGAVANVGVEVKEAALITRKRRCKD